MPRSPPLSKSKVNDPATMPEITREYYRTTWGFDPVADGRIRKRVRSWYEECFPLSQDLPLHAVGVTICARVEWQGEAIYNRIVFRRVDDKGQRREASVECTHTVVYAGPASDAFDLADTLETIESSPNIPAPDPREMLDRSRKPVTLPPWEHFAALKSYVAAVADMGVIALLRQSIVAPPAGPEDGLPFGFNGQMQEQVARALRAVAPRAMFAIYYDLTCEFLDAHPPVAQVERWLGRAGFFHGRSKRRHWGLLLRRMDAPELLHVFRHTAIADGLQDRLFTKPELLARAEAIAPDLPWDTLRLEWEARRAAEDAREGGDLNILPPAEVWGRKPFCSYTFPRDILSPDTTNLRRSRVRAYLRDLKGAYSGELRDYDMAVFCEEWAKYVSSHLDAVLTEPFPANHARPYPIHHWDSTHKHYLALPPTEVADFIEHGTHEERRNVVLTNPLPPELQESLATHWDFATRLALIGNPGTIPAVLATLAQDPQPCVQLAATARVRRGTASFEPLFGEILDPGEIIWLFASYPRFFFQFGVTTWGDGSDAYRDWFEDSFSKIKDKKIFPGELYLLAYVEGVLLEEGERWPNKTHLAFHGLTPYACGHLPCLFFGTDLQKY